MSVEVRVLSAHWESPACRGFCVRVATTSLRLLDVQMMGASHVIRSRRCPGPDRGERHHLWMPTICRFYGIGPDVLRRSWPPALPRATRRRPGQGVRIDEIDVIDSDLGQRQLRLVLAWAELHQAELLENRQRARAGETLQQIDPLR